MVLREQRRLGPHVVVTVIVSILVPAPVAGQAATTQKRYYAHPAVEDCFGVIAPWYQGQNGQIDLRVRVAAEFLKRHPWVAPPEAAMAGPHYLFNPRVDLDPSGTIRVLPASDQMNGNLGQRFKYITESLPRYYRYSGDPSVLGHLKIAADFVLENYLTPADHPWPRFPISVPLQGKPYRQAAPGGWIQLDLSAGMGLGMIRVYQLTGDRRYLEAARHWGDVRRPGKQHRRAPSGVPPEPHSCSGRRSDTAGRPGARGLYAQAIGGGRLDRLDPA